jgi:hypothetical protein
MLDGIVSVYKFQCNVLLFVCEFASVVYFFSSSYIKQSCLFVGSVPSLCRVN